MSARRILITGASAGIGWALAAHYARAHGADLRLGLVARRGERLAALQEQLAASGATVWLYPADVRDSARMAEVVASFADAAGGLDLLVANAGISRSDDLPQGEAAPTAEVIGINVQGVINTLVPAVPIMARQGSGHLVTVGSVAGFRGLPGKGAYCASKAAVKMLMDAYRPVLRPQGIRVTTICPGWVESELTADNPYPMPFLMSAEKAARIIARAIAAGRTTYIFPWQMRLVVPLMRLVPDRLLPTLAARS